MQRVVGHLRRDESRHLAYGVFLLSRLVAEHGDPVWNAVQARLEALLEPAMGMIAEIFAEYPVMPFGLRMEEFADFALAQFGRRVARLERARGQTLAQVYGERLESEDGAQTGLPEPLPSP
jgi:ribonucleoside-diphosphate reductase beta chain